MITPLPRFEKTPKGWMVMFGKHKGDYLDEVPEDYLRWFRREVQDATAEEQEIVRKELDRRKHEGVGSFDFGE